ncbi:unnamed protein product [Amoebophrya sp. A120]|nr:unnamed protein product [Amoebophrya sp. A120]|eukprot:GSA120T00015260001.1
MGCTHSEFQQRRVLGPSQLQKTASTDTVGHLEAFAVLEDAPGGVTSVRDGSSPQKDIKERHLHTGKSKSHLHPSSGGADMKMTSSRVRTSDISPFDRKAPPAGSPISIGAASSPHKVHPSSSRVSSPEKENFRVGFVGVVEEEDEPSTSAEELHHNKPCAFVSASGAGVDPDGRKVGNNSTSTATRQKVTWRASKLPEDQQADGRWRKKGRSAARATGFATDLQGGGAYADQYPPPSGACNTGGRTPFSEHEQDQSDADASGSCSSESRNLYTSGLFGVRLDNEDFANLDRRIPRVPVQTQCSEFELLMATDFSRVFRCVWRYDMQAPAPQSKGAGQKHQTDASDDRSTTQRRTNPDPAGHTTYRSSLRTVDTNKAPPSEILRDREGFSRLRGSAQDSTQRTSATFRDELSRTMTRTGFFRPTKQDPWDGCTVKGVNNGRFFALKEVSKRSPHMEAFTKEVQMLAHLQHSNIVRFFGVYLEDPFSLYFLSELCKMDSQEYTEQLPKRWTRLQPITFFSRPLGINCDANDPVYRVTTADGQAERLGVRPHWLLRRHPTTGEGLHRTELIQVMKEFPLPLTVEFENEEEYNRRLLALVRQFLLTLHYLHEEKRIVHGDLKPGNVLVDMKDRLKLCDFGSAIQVSGKGFLQSCSCGTEGFRAPEITDPNKMGYDGFRADIYSCGKTLNLWTRNPDAGVSWDFSINPALRWMIGESTQEEPLMRPKIGYMLSSVFDDVPFAAS